MSPEETIEVNGLKVKIFHDDDCMSPREQDNVAVIYGMHRRYTIGDGEPPPDEIEALERGGTNALQEYLRKKKGMIAFDLVGLLDHSGLYFYLGGGPAVSDSAGWDSGTVGYTYVTKKRCDELGVKRKNAQEAMEVEFREYSSWVEGDCWGYVVEGEDGDIDSCWGFIGMEYAKEEGIEAAKHYALSDLYVDAAPVEEAIA